jgi:hypothetical protein
VTRRHGLPSVAPAACPGGPTGGPGAASDPSIRPGAFCRSLLNALEAAESQTRRRKRDQAPDRFGLAVKRELLEQAVAADPEPESFETWLLEQVIRSPHAGSVRAMCEQIFLEYRMAERQHDLAAWLAAGAPSDDVEPERPRRERDRRNSPDAPDRWRGTDDPWIACTCHLPQR